MNVGKFLDDREKRVNYQKKLTEKYKLPLAVLRVNFPGENKNNPLADNIITAVSEEMDAVFGEKTVHKENFRNLEGKFFFYIIDREASDIKKDTVIIEETHGLGRCTDIDVYTIEGISVSRKDLNIFPRKCFLCNEIAYKCARSMKHGYDELYNFLEERYRSHLSHKLSTAVLEGAINEVSVYPSFGLVSPLNSGSHKDMDFYTFVESSFSIEKAFYDIARIGYSDMELSSAFKLAREIGKKAEMSMMKATGNVNTHKGFIFLMGVVVLAVSRNFYLGKGVEELSDMIKKISGDIFDDFKEIEKKDRKILTHGEKLYLKMGFTGIRGEVRKGLAEIFKKILPFYDEKLKKHGKNLACVMTLIFLMSMLDDSTIVHRHGKEMLKTVKGEAERLVNITDMKMLTDFEKSCIGRNISPGGSADMLALILFLHKIYY